ncbi:radical SAM protein [Clostridium sp. BNL1100]|uniref:PapB family radical SAM/SPASM ranthipeptide maturase n=1 Tax=Clostridium sp. BNL1100 TaxID=755731 RepID=UPI00024A7AE2|nr:radical SAM protein [Clostridium sp. BNL1100]AEY67466.1 radical SAM additional 4Fe4S-binding domain protein [Clostridium sp. BNL1100]
MYKPQDKINFKEYMEFCENNKNYIYTIDDGKVFHVDDKTLRLLQQSGRSYNEICENISDVFSRDELDGILEKMSKYNFITSGVLPKGEPSPKLTNDISTLTLLVTQACNLRCSYCYGEDGSYNDNGIMDIQTAKKAVDFLLTKTHQDKVSVCFFGGEPLLNFTLIKEIVSYCREKERETQKRIAFSMTTNGTKINEEISKYIVENSIRLQISIDGDRATHDTNRYYSDKTGSHHNVIKNTEYLRNLGLLDARATVTGKNMDLVSTYNYLKSIGFKGVTLSPAFNLLSDGEYDLLADAYRELYLYFEKFIKNREFDKVLENKSFMQEINQINSAMKRRVSCGVGRNLYAVDIHGNLFPCQRFVSNKDFKVGSIYENDDGQEEFVSKINIDNYEKCASCWVRNLCVSGCSHNNLSSTGDVNLPYEPFCKFTRKVKKEVIGIYLRLTPEEKKILFKSKTK